MFILLWCHRDVGIIIFGLFIKIFVNQEVKEVVDKVILAYLALIANKLAKIVWGLDIFLFNHDGKMVFVRGGRIEKVKEKMSC